MQVSATYVKIIKDIWCTKKQGIDFTQPGLVTPQTAKHEDKERL